MNRFGLIKTMASKNSSVNKKREHHRVEKNVFEVLQQYDISLSTKVKNILTRLEFRDLRSISMIENVEELQNEIINLVSDESFSKTLSEQDKMDLFGVFYSNPKSFRFMPGEKNSIKAAIQLSREILQKYSENYVFEKPVDGQKRKKSESTFSQALLSKKESTMSNEGDEKSDTEVNQHEGELHPVLKKKKTLSQYINHWLNHTRINVSGDYVNKGYTVDDFKCTITCISAGCEKLNPFRATADAYDGWKISSFVRHIQLIHHTQPKDLQNDILTTVDSTKRTNPSVDTHPGHIFRSYFSYKTYSHIFYFVDGSLAPIQTIRNLPPYSTTGSSSESIHHHRQELADMTNLAVSPGGSFFHRTRSATTVIQPQHF